MGGDLKKISESRNDTFALRSTEIPTMEKNPLEQRSYENGVQIQKSPKEDGNLEHEERRK